MKPVFIIICIITSSQADSAFVMNKHFFRWFVFFSSSFFFSPQFTPVKSFSISRSALSQMEFLLLFQSFNMRSSDFFFLRGLSSVVFPFQKLVAPN